MITIIIIYLAGVVLSYIMQRTEIASEKDSFTFGNRLLAASLSLLSFAMVLIILITAWIKQISLTGYWDEPVKKEVEEKPVKLTKKPVLN